jgi:hypothetical protein
MKTYDPTANVLIFKGIPISSYAPDSFITVSRNTKNVEMTVGAGGDVVRVFTADHSGKIVVDIVAASQTNDLLSAVQQSDEVNHDGVGSVMLQDLNGTTFAHGDEACLEGPSDIKRGKGMPTQQWTILVANIEQFAGGASS